ncbi:MAG: hypothetical protein ACF8SC_05720 [Phycisphaerales bacterium JB037]
MRAGEETTRSGEMSPAEAEARRLFQRVLSRWAMDALHLRRLGLDRPCFRPTPAGALAIPARGAVRA